MAKNFNGNSKLSSLISTPVPRTAKPSSEFYSIFSDEEVLSIIHALEVRREIPLKYSYKGTGAKTWDSFYLKYIIPRWYRISNPEIDLLRENFNNGNLKSSEKVNIVDVGAGNSYPVKEFIGRLNELDRVNKYIALDISEELLKLSKQNFTKWFPKIDFISCRIDIENHSLFEKLSGNLTNLETDSTAKIILHLGVTMGNHHDRTGVLKNFRNSMGKNDLLVFTNEIGSNSEWDGTVRGGFKYHVDQVYAWIKKNIGIRGEDCELVRKYDEKTDSIVATMKIRHNYTINFCFMGLDKTMEIFEGEEITIWRQHKYEIPEILQEIERAGLQLVHYSTDKYLSNIMVICKVATT
ncbi:MAG: L-histidine N(alpha)-methyltransferase [Coleofasciculus sp. S288]|nr:L-histidine N(alpha)-methyltransferase [Coleofasciculus sp. S288]